MKILFCIDSLEKGGAERVISSLSNTFINNNEVTIITMVNRKIEYNLDKNIKLYTLEDEAIVKNNIKYKILEMKRLYKIILKEKPDVIVSFLPEPSFRVLLLRKLIKIPIIVSVRNDPKAECTACKRKILMKWLYPFADGFVFQTEEAQKFFNKKIQKKSTIIPNPIKKDFLARNRYKGKNENIIVSVGRLEKQKNHELLIDAFYNVQEKLKKYKLIIYGEGTLRTKLEEKIKNLNMQDRIFLPGVVDDVAINIEKAKIFILSSDYEGMPNALMEAMALGLVCVSTDCPCGGPRFLIENGKSGYLVEVRNKEELAKIIDKIVNFTTESELEEISMNARNVALNLQEEKINAVWYEYICSILKKSNEL